MRKPVELLKACEVLQEWEAILRVGTAMFALPSRIGARILTLSRADVAAIDDEIRSAWTALGSGSDDLPQAGS